MNTPEHCLKRGGWMYRVGETVFQISVENPAGVNCDIKQIILDGKVLNGNEIPSREDGGEHQVIVVLGAVGETM